jgi:hypothetical protein
MLASEKDRGRYRNRNRGKKKKVFRRQDKRRDAASTRIRLQRPVPYQFSMQEKA